MSRADWINDQVDKNLVLNLMEFIRIPNQSPAYDPQWESNGLLMKAAEFARQWVLAQQLDNCRVELFAPAGRTPLLLVVVDTPSPNANVLFYGHLDKQPPNVGWSPGLGPYAPVLKDNLLYGRGSADDGYAIFAAVLLVKALQREGKLAHRAVFFFECSEESSSRDAYQHFFTFKDVIGRPDVVYVIDGAAHDYNRLYVNTSLRGVVNFTLKATTLKLSLHSGVFGGMVADPFRVLRKLLDNFEEARSGRLPRELYVPIPPERVAEMEEFLAEFDGKYEKNFPYKDKTQPMASAGFVLMENRAWKPQLAVIGQSGLPSLDQASNLIHASLSLVISVRTPPTLDLASAAQFIKDFFTKTAAPYNAKIEVTDFHLGPGCNLPAVSPGFRALLNESSQQVFGKKALLSSEGITIPIVDFFRQMFGDKTNYVVCGVSSATTNMHGPNENLDVAYLKKFIAAHACLLEKFRKS